MKIKNIMLLRELFVLSIGYLVFIIAIFLSESDLKYKLVGVFGVYTYFLFILFMISMPLKDISEV